MSIKDVPTCELCRELEQRLGVERVIVHDGSSLVITGDGEQKKLKEPVRTGPALVYVVID